MTSTVVPDTAEARGRSHPNLWFWLSTAVLTAIGLGIRIAAVLGRPNRPPGGDAYYFHYAANLLAEGYGFIDPFYYYPHQLHHHIQTASWPPGFVWTLAAAAVFGFKSYFAQRIWAGIVGSAAIVVCAMAGREIGGRRVGVLAALVIAIYPNIWMSDEPALSETLVPLLVGLILWAAYRFWKRPTLRRAGVLSLCISVAALARDELTVLFLFLVIPLFLLARGADWRRRLTLIGVGAAVAIVVIGPWVGYNMSRFSKPVLISDGLGVTLASSDCAQTWNGGPLEGFWDINCALIPLPKHVDESVTSSIEEKHAIKFIKSHLNRVVPVALAKLGRGFAFFEPLQQIRLDVFFEVRPDHWALIGLWSYYALFGLSIFGFVVLVRRKVTSIPLIAVTLTTIVTMLVAFGDTRYRTAFEVVLAMLAPMAIDGLLNVLFRRPRPIETHEPLSGRPSPDGAASGPARIWRRTKREPLAQP